MFSHKIINIHVFFCWSLVLFCHGSVQGFQSKLLQEISVWNSSSCSHSLPQTLHSGPQWNGSSSHQPSLQKHHNNQQPQLLPEDKDSTLISDFRLDDTFSDERRNVEIHQSVSWQVDIVICFHFIKLHQVDDSFHLLWRRRQTKKGGEFLYFSSIVLWKHSSQTLTWQKWARANKTTGFWLKYLEQIFIEHEVDVGISLFFLPPVVHMVIPGSKNHWQEDLHWYYTPSIYTVKNV